MPDDTGFQDRVRKIENLIEALERTADPVVRGKARELVQLILEMHTVGLAKIMELTHQLGTSGITDALVRDDLVGSLLLLHGLHPLDVESRVRGALVKVQPRLLVHGGRVELIAMEDTLVRLRLSLDAQQGAATAQAEQLQRWIEEAICAAAPEVSAVEFAGTRRAALLSLPLVAGEFARGQV